MKIPKMADAVGEIDQDLVGAAAKDTKKAKRSLARWGLLVAACLCVVILAGVIVVPMLRGEEELPDVPPRETVSFGDLERHYKQQAIGGAETAIEWPAEYLSAMEKHAYIVWSLRNYATSGIEVQTHNLGEKLGNYLGYEVREVKGAPREHVIALGIEGVYYAYRCRDGYDDKPETLGELFDRYNLAEVLELDRFSTADDKYHHSTGEYGLTAGDAYIIEVLSSCRDAKVYADSDHWQGSEPYISFTVTSDALGVYKKAMYITEDGYLWTNVFEYAYIYEIGTEAASKIIAYAMENSVEKPMEPYEYRLAGTLVKIEDGYAYVDDSIMCVNEDEGMVFRVSLADIRVRRCIEYAGVSVGDLVVVTFRGGIDLEDGNLILDARSIDEAILTDDGGAAVPE